MKAFEQRATHLNTRHLHIKDLLHKGGASLKAWEHGHKSLGAVAGSQTPDLFHLQATVDAHHTALTGPSDDTVTNAANYPPDGEVFGTDPEPDPAPAPTSEPDPDPAGEPDDSMSGDEMSGDG